jgi:hypothetical protein
MAFYRVLPNTTAMPGSWMIECLISGVVVRRICENFHTSQEAEAVALRMRQDEDVGPAAPSFSNSDAMSRAAGLFNQALEGTPAGQR